MKKNHPAKIDQDEAIYERCAGIDVHKNGHDFKITTMNENHSSLR